MPPQSTLCGMSPTNPMEQSFPTPYTCEFIPLPNTMILSFISLYRRSACSECFYTAFYIVMHAQSNYCHVSVCRNSVEYHNQSTPGNLTVEGLSPFTLYTVRVEACTRFGCTRSPLEQVITLESGKYIYEQCTRSFHTMDACIYLYTLSPAPVGLASPLVLITGSTSANISWGKFISDWFKAHMFQVSAQIICFRCS